MFYTDHSSPSKIRLWFIRTIQPQISFPKNLFKDFQGWTYPLTSYWDGTSLAVASILAMTMLGSLDNYKWRINKLCCWAQTSQEHKYYMQPCFQSDFHLLSKLLVFRLQALAVATPGSIELNQHILAVIVDNGIKVLSHQNLGKKHRKRNGNRSGLEHSYLRLTHNLLYLTPWYKP